MSPSHVFVSGATGYIAQHIVKQLLSKGYGVVGSVRSAEKGASLEKLFNSKSFSYEVVKAIEEDGAFDEALKKHPEITAFLHTASPFYYNAKDIEKELLIPAISGTKNALSSIKRNAPQIKKVVVTSSYAAMSPKDPSDPKTVVNEESWNPLTWEQTLSSPRLGYSGSKKFAEKAVWEFVQNEKPAFDVAVINPVFVFGPQAFDDNVKGTLNTSAEIINSILKLKQTDDVPDTKGGFIDVRDVATAHVIALEREDAKNQRFVLEESYFTAQEVLDIIHEKFPDFASKLPKGDPGSNKALTFAVIDNKKTRNFLGFKFYSLEESIVDTVKQILANNKTA